MCFCQSSLHDVNEIRRSAIEESYHVVLLTSLVENSAVQDSSIMPIVRIIEENFRDVEFTVELVDEENMKYMNFEPKSSNLESSNVSLYLWPRYASSNVFFSSIIEYIMA